MVTLDFSTAGLGAAVKEFFISAVKTTLVALLAFAGFRLANIHVGLDNPNYDLYTLLIVVGRALVSSGRIWVTTLPGTVDPVLSQTAGTDVALG